jgi:hypothetical protein
MNEQLNVSDRVAHHRDASVIGTILMIHNDKQSCLIAWDNYLGVFDERLPCLIPIKYCVNK